MKRISHRRRICFVTGTRAEYGLMRSVMSAIEAHPKLQLQLIVTGMHLHPRHGKSIDTIRADGQTIDATIPWKATATAADLARQVGLASSAMAETVSRLKTDVVLVVGDRVEAFAAASAGQVSQRVVAHIHGGDRATGQIDDSLRHAITKLSHVHFPATKQSAARLIKLGEKRSTIHRVGSPAVDGIVEAAAQAREIRAMFPRIDARRYALILLHPVDGDDKCEHERAAQVLVGVQRSGIEQTVVVYPNNDPGAAGIVRFWTEQAGVLTYAKPDVSRSTYLGLLRDAAVLVGNSSSGIIEAGSFGTPVIDVGPRQEGRERGGNVVNVRYSVPSIARAVARAWNDGRPLRYRAANTYGDGQAASRIAGVLADMPITPQTLRKLITY